jgi:hypothetical protein
MFAISSRWSPSRSSPASPATHSADDASTAPEDAAVASPGTPVTEKSHAAPAAAVEATSAQPSAARAARATPRSPSTGASCRDQEPAGQEATGSIAAIAGSVAIARRVPVVLPKRVAMAPCVSHVNPPASAATASPVAALASTSEDRATKTTGSSSQPIPESTRPGPWERRATTAPTPTNPAW